MKLPKKRNPNSKSSTEAQATYESLLRAATFHGRKNRHTVGSKIAKGDLFNEDNGFIKHWMNQSLDDREAERNSLIEQLQSELDGMKSGCTFFDEQLRCEPAKSRGGFDTLDFELIRLTLEYLGVQQSPNIRPFITPRSVKDAKIKALAANLQRSTKILETLADQCDREAIELLAHHALHLAEWLSSLRKKNLNLLKPVARKSIFWPVLKSRCQHFDDIGKSLSDDDAVLLHVLEVGKEHPIKGRKINLRDELGVLMVDLLNCIASYKAGGCNFIPPNCKPPFGWRYEALRLPHLAPKKNIVNEWVTVMELALNARFDSPKAMADKFKHLVSPMKRVGTKTTLGELRHLMRCRLKGMAGMGVRGRVDSIPSSAWAISRTKSLKKSKAGS